MKNKNQTNEKENLIKTFDKRHFYNNDDSAKVYIFALLLPIILSFVVSFIAGMIARGVGLDSDTLSTSLGYLIPASFIAPLCFTGIYFGYNKMFRITYSASTVTNKPKVSDVFMGIFVALLALFGTLMFTNCHDQFLLDVLKFPSLVEMVEKGQSFILPLSNWGWLVLSIFLFALLPAIAEELVFRGVVLQGLRKNFSDGVAIVLSGLMFALMHCNLQQLVYPFLLGMVFGWIALRTGSIWVTVIAHALNNTVALILGFLGEKYKFQILPFQNTWWYILIAFLLLFVVAGIYYLIDRFYFKSKNRNEVEKEKVTKASPFLWLGLSLGGVLLILSTIVEYLG